MFKIFKTKRKLLNNVQFISNHRKPEKIHQRSISSFSLDSESRNSNKSSHLQNNKFLIPCNFSWANSSVLLKSNKINFVGQSVRHFSDLPDIFEPPRPRYEGMIKILVDSPPIEFVQNHLVMLHSSLGLPWWATIVLVTCTARTLITLPSAFYQVCND